MARLVRVVIPGIPHHITQRGNRRLETFFSDADYAEYLSLMSHWCNRYRIDIWAYCLKPNHVHLIAIPEITENLSRGIGEAHRRYTRYVHYQKGWKRHLWQGRFSSFPMDENYLLTAVRYIELNPVRAGLVRRPEDYKWSSCKANLHHENDIIVNVKPLLNIVPDWGDFLLSESYEDNFAIFRQHERTGRPLGGERFIEKLEGLTCRVLKKKKPGPKKKTTK